MPDTPEQPRPLGDIPTPVLAAELQRRQCAYSGHDLDVINQAGEPVGLSCACGRSWVVQPA